MCEVALSWNVNISGLMLGSSSLSAGPTNQSLGAEEYHGHSKEEEILQDSDRGDFGA
jgi:hypothetical protein